MRYAMFALLVGCLLGQVRAADAPATQPSTASLLGGRIEYSPPARWTNMRSNLPADTAAVYIAPDRDGFFAIQALPANAAVTPQAAQKIVAQLRVNHKKANQEIVEGPTIEKDDQFAINIHERYKTKTGRIADERHLYRLVGGHAMELDVQSLSEDDEHIATVHKAGEETLLSAKWVKPAPSKRKAA